MTTLRMRMASVAAALCLSALLVPDATAATCPRPQAFSGTLLPGQTDSIAVTIPLKGDVTVQFNPMYPFWGPAGQTVRMAIGGNSITGIGSLAMSFAQVDPGTYLVQLRGQHLGLDGLAALPYQLVVTERGC